MSWGPHWIACMIKLRTFSPSKRLQGRTQLPRNGKLFLSYLQGKEEESSSRICHLLTPVLESLSTSRAMWWILHHISNHFWLQTLSIVYLGKIQESSDCRGHISKWRSFPSLPKERKLQRNSRLLSLEMLNQRIHLPFPCGPILFDVPLNSLNPSISAIKLLSHSKDSKSLL